LRRSLDALPNQTARTILKGIGIAIVGVIVTETVGVSVTTLLNGKDAEGAAAPQGMALQKAQHPP